MQCSIVPQQDLQYLQSLMPNVPNIRYKILKLSMAILGHWALDIYSCLEEMSFYC